MIRVVFACVNNAGRSQMAAAWFNALADATRAQAISAGTQPASHVHAEVLAAMQEVGIDLSSSKPQILTPAMLSDASHLVTMGCGEACPVAPPSVRRLDWPIEDPKGGSMSRVKQIRDEIRGRVERLISDLDVNSRNGASGAAW
jgi:arsenate reductase